MSGLNNNNVIKLQILIFGIEKRANPLSLKYMKICRLFMITGAMWPTKVFGGLSMLVQPFHQIVLQVLTMIVIVGQFNYIILNFKILPFYELADVYITLFLSFMVLFRITLPFFNSHAALGKRFVQQVHLMHYKSKGGCYKTICEKVDFFSHCYTLAMMAMILGGMILFNLSPLYNNFKNGVFTNSVAENTTYVFSINYVYSRFNPHEHFALVTLLNYLLSYNCTVIICCSDLYLSLIVFQIIGHIQILQHNLEHFPKPANQVTYQYDSQENKVNHTRIAECVEHHRLVVSFTEDMSEFYGPMLAFTYVYHMVSCCLLLLECSVGEPDALARYGPLTVIVFSQLIQVSVLFEVVETESDKLKYAVYGMPWESMDLPNQRSVCILLQRIQTPINVTAMGMMPVGVQTMLKILKSTFTYFAFLRSLDE